MNKGELISKVLDKYASYKEKRLSRAWIDASRYVETYSEYTDLRSYYYDYADNHKDLSKYLNGLNEKILQKMLEA